MHEFHNLLVGRACLNKHREEWSKFDLLDVNPLCCKRKTGLKFTAVHLESAS